jgi:hypothetical protein
MDPVSLPKPDQSQPRTKDELLSKIAVDGVQGNLPGLQDGGAEMVKEIDRTHPIFFIALANLEAVNIGNREKTSDYDEIKKAFEDGDANSLKILLGYY